MILGAEIGMLLYGLYALFFGRFQLSKQRTVEGSYARLAGFILILPLPLMFGLGFLAGIRGTIPPQSTLIAIEVVMLIGCIIASYLVVYSAPPEYDA